LFLRLFSLLVIIFSYQSTSYAQNLVPNGDFETFSECPDDHSQIERATGWSSYRGTADYFNACDLSHFVGTPLNETHGFQYPLSGNTYGGLIGKAYNNDREIMGTELATPLTIGTEYYIEFYWSRTFGGVYHANCDCASSHLGALFTTHSYHNINNIIPVTNFAHIYDPTLLVDSANWVKISGWFTADSAYTHIAIGDFFDLDSNLVAYYNGTSETLSLNTYYYIEDVCVATDPAMCGVVNVSNTIEESNTIRLFPNPASAILTIQTDLPIVSISVVALDGKQLLLNSMGSKKIDISSLPEGMYLVWIITERERIIKKMIKR